MAEIFNKKASFDFFLTEKTEAGIVLTGSEVKSIRSGSASLVDSYVKIINNEAVLINAYIAPYKYAVDPSYDPRRSRKLLLNKAEIEFFAGKIASSNLTIVPTKVYTTHNLVKLEIALGTAKKKADKRDTLKKKVINREIESYLRADKLKSQQKD